VSTSRFRAALAALARLRRSRWVGPVALLLVAGFWALFLGRQLRALAQYAWRFDPASLAIALGFAALYHLTLAFCWSWLLRRMGGGLPYRQALRVWQSSMLARYVPGNVWHILSRMALAERLGTPPARVLASSTLEQALNVIGALALAGLTFPFWGLPATDQFWLLALVPLGLLALHPRLAGGALAWAARRFNRPQLAWRYRYREILLATAGYMLAMAWVGLALYATLSGLAHVTPAQLPLYIGTGALAWAVGYLSFLTPSGLGVREGMLVLILSQVMPVPAAVVGSLLYRLVVTLAELAMAGVTAVAGRSELEAITDLTPPAPLP
jgi:uncharacterized membrane protein YbhN (UPF0104 family)